MRKKKIPCNWRIYKEVIDKLGQIASKKGYHTVPQLVNVILTEYVDNESV